MYNIYIYIYISYISGLKENVLHSPVMVEVLYLIGRNKVGP